VIALNGTAAKAPAHLESAVAQIETMRAAPLRELSRIEDVLRRNTALAPSLRRAREASAAQLRAAVDLYDGVITILQGEAPPPDGPPKLPSLARNVERLEQALAAWVRLEEMRAGAPSPALLRAVAYVRETTTLAP